MQKKWKSFVKKINTKPDDFETVLKTIKVFLKEPFESAVQDKYYIKQWSAYIQKWI